MSERLVSQIEKIPLSGEDLILMAKNFGLNNVKWILYDDLDKFKNLNELFGDNIAVYILLRIRDIDSGGHKSVGHWITLIHHKEKNKYYHYDSYGLNINQELDITHEPNFMKKLVSGIEIQVNTNKHQNFSGDINTCGRWTVLRSLFWHLDNVEFHRLVIKPIVPFYVKNTDALVSLLTGLMVKRDRVLIDYYNKQEKN